MYGVHGQIALVDLSRSKTYVYTLDEKVFELFIGGKGLLYYLGYKHIPVEGDALDPTKNALIVAPGLLAGLAPASSKVGFLAKSPLTGILCDTYAGQVFAAKLKLAGFDALIIKGASRDPVYIYVENGEVEIRGASHLWGSNVYDTVNGVKAETRKGASVAAIGPAGENLVRFANIMVDGVRAAGRCGLGAVMGSMKLKAIAVWGWRKPRIAHPEKLKKLYVEVYEKLRRDPLGEYTSKYGTLKGVESCSKHAMCPAYHWTKPWLPEEVASKLSAEEVLAREAPKTDYKMLAGSIWGWGCPIKCSKLARSRKKGFEHLIVKPEYEILAMLGLAVGVLDVDEILHIEWLVNAFGMDAISFGETVAWLMELYEKRLVGRKELTCLNHEPKFGNAEAVRELAQLIAYRRGIGAILAEGVARAAQILGRGANIAVHVKGLEAPAWDPRGRRGLGLSYATADIGASHLRGWPSGSEPPSKGPAREKIASLIRDRDRKALIDSLGLCAFPPYRDEDIEALYEAVTGQKRPISELMLVGHRVEALARIFAAIAGKVPEADTIPPRWMEPIPEGPFKGEKAFLDWNDLREAVREYYRARGFHEEYGVPLPETLERLGMTWAIDDANRALTLVSRRLSSLHV